MIAGDGADDDRSGDDAHDVAPPVTSTPYARRTPQPSRFLIGIVLIALAASEGVGAFGPLIRFTASFSPDFRGISNWRGFGWMLLLLAVATVVAIVIDLVEPTTSLKAVVATLFAAMAVIGGFYVVQFGWFAQPGVPSEAGWGSILSLASGVAGLGLAIVWLRTTPSRAVDSA